MAPHKNKRARRGRQKPWGNQNIIFINFEPDLNNDDLSIFPKNNPSYKNDLLVF